MKNNLFDLSSKTALVTGAAGLLGLSHTKALLASGAHVILTDLNNNLLEEAKKSLSEECDFKSFS